LFSDFGWENPRAKPKPRFFRGAGHTRYLQTSTYGKCPSLYPYVPNV
jgi:hypothetical protein